MKKLILFSGIFLLFLSCDDLYKTTVYVKFDNKTFFDQKQLWQSSDIKNYSYNLSLSYPPASGYNGKIIVENSIYVDNIPSLELYTIDDENDWKKYSTIDTIYFTIENIFIDNSNIKVSRNDVYLEEIIVEYNKVNHFPTKINYIYYYPGNYNMSPDFVLRTIYLNDFEEDFKILYSLYPPLKL